MTWWIGTAQQLAYFLALLGYLFATWQALRLAGNHSDAFTGVLREKAPDGPLVPASDSSGSPFVPPASFARLVGIIGAAMLVGFLWSYGLLILSSMIPNAGSAFSKEAALAVSNTKKAIGDQADSFIYVGLALFAPYGANQLARILASRSGSAGGGTSGADQEDVKADKDLKPELPSPSD